MISIRPAEVNDWKRLLDWVNSPDSLSNKLLTLEPITEKTHRLWFSKALKKADLHIFIIEHNGMPAGQLRFDNSSQQQETSLSFVIDVFVQKEFRGHGLAKASLKQAIAQIRKYYSSTELFFIADVKKENSASASLFKHLGFQKEKMLESHSTYCLKPVSRSKYKE